MPAVLITGANRGLGLAFARQYTASGWRVMACSRSESPELQQLAGNAAAVSIHQLDVSDHAGIDRLAAELAGQPIDVLLNNAGIYGHVAFAAGGMAHQAFGDTDFASWEQVLRVNLFGPMKMAEAFVGHVEQSAQKKIVTLSSIVGSVALNTSGGIYAYRTSKAAVNMLMQSMGIDLKKRGIIAVAIHPGWARTEMGGAGAEINADEAVAGVIGVIGGLEAASTGRLLTYDGATLPY